MILLKKYLLLGVMLLVSFSLLAQKKMQRDKIDPQFLQLIDSAKNVKLKAGCPPASKKKGQVSSPKQTYHCIIYTKNSAALRKQGVTLNSVLPNFATAVATLEQIQTISTHPDVTFIEFPRKDTLDKEPR